VFFFLFSEFRRVPYPSPRSVPGAPRWRRFGELPFHARRLLSNFLLSVFFGFNAPHPSFLIYFFLLDSFFFFNRLAPSFPRPFRRFVVPSPTWSCHFRSPVFPFRLFLGRVLLRTWCARVINIVSNDLLSDTTLLHQTHSFSFPTVRSFFLSCGLVDFFWPIEGYWCLPLVFCFLFFRLVREMFFFWQFSFFIRIVTGYYESGLCNPVPTP